MSTKYQISFEEILEDKTGETSTIKQSSEDLEIEHQRLALEIDKNEKELVRQSDLAENLTSVRAIADKIGTPGPTEVALFRVAANMAVAGTDEDAHDYLPAVESNKPIDISYFDEKIKTIIKNIFELKAKISELKSKKK